MRGEIDHASRIAIAIAGFVGGEILVVIIVVNYVSISIEIEVEIEIGRQKHERHHEGAHKYVKHLARA